MNKNSKTKQQLLLEVEELRTKLDIAQQRLQEADERMQKEMTERKRAEEDFVRAQKHAEGIVETIREPLLVLAADLKVISANQSFYRIFKVTPEETEGRFIYSVGDNQWDIPALRKLLGEIVPQNSQFTDFEVDHKFPGIGRRKMILNARRIYREGKGTEMILLAIEDITERKQMEGALEVSETRFRRLFETAQDGILILDADTGDITNVNPFLMDMLGYGHDHFWGKKLWEIGAFKDIEASKVAFSELQTKGYVRYEGLPLQTRDGRLIDVEFVSNVYLVDHHKVIQCNIRDITKRKQLEDTQTFLVQCGLPAAGEDFFESLARYLAQKLGMDYVCIDRLQEEGLIAQTVAIYFDGEIEDNLTYTLKDTPCGDVVGKTICCFPKGVRHLFPQDTVLQEMMAESYIGTTLWNSKGQPIGLIAVIGRQPLLNPQVAESILKLAALRAAGELERRVAEEALRHRSLELQQLTETLEQRVMERTAELAKSNQALQLEVEERKRIEDVLRQSEVKYRTVADNTYDWEWWRDPKGNFIYVSPSCKRITHYDPDKFIKDTDFLLRIIHPDDKSPFIRHLTEIEETHTSGYMEFRIIRPDGSYRWIGHSCQPVFDREGNFLGRRGSNRDITERKFSDKRLQESENHLRLLSSQLLTAQETERKRIAREIHDSIGQTLAAIKFGLESKLDQMSGGSPPPGISIENIIVLAQNGIEEARRIQMDLRPSILDDLGILATLQWFCREFEKIYSIIHIEKQIHLQEEDISDQLKTEIFRIMQEALNNIAKYSKATLVNLSLKRREGGVELVIEDNGTGFDLESAGGGFGLGSMRERTELSGGSFEIESTLGKGTRIRAKWPIS